MSYNSLYFLLNSVTFPAVEKRYNQEILAFGRRLKQLRESQKFTQLDLELQSGISRTEISRIENGLKNIEFMTIVKLAEALKVNLSMFFEDVSSSSPN